jgi:hypothetical protein
VQNSRINKKWLVSRAAAIESWVVASADICGNKRKCRVHFRISRKTATNPEAAADAFGQLKY